MTNHLMYFWVDGAVVIKRWGDANPICRQAFCIDTEESGATLRYGIFGAKEVVGWFPVPFENFPPEFRVHLLLLGVS